jgi:hypothetical protein
MTRPHPHPSPLIREALTLVRPTAAQLCAYLGIRPGTLNGYHAGTRKAPPVVAPALAAYLRTHARELEAMADTLDASVAAPVG